MSGQAGGFTMKVYTNIENTSRRTDIHRAVVKPRVRQRLQCVWALFVPLLTNEGSSLGQARVHSFTLETSLLVSSSDLLPEAISKYQIKLRIFSSLRPLIHWQSGFPQREIFFSIKLLRSATAAFLCRQQNEMRWATLSDAPSLLGRGKHEFHSFSIILRRGTFCGWKIWACEW